MKPILISLSFLFSFYNCISQTKQDSIKLNEVTVKAYLSEQNLISLPSSAAVISKQQIQQNSVHSLLPVLNSISGVKMEERSPGSYRISIRGSLLRSPYGVRNIKVYYDDFPLTDAGGNTYFNLIDQSAINNIEILKGPDGSLFGANSGGVILLNTLANTNETSININAGSYGLFKENIGINGKKKDLEFNFHQAFQYSNGYRDNSQLKRNFFQTAQKWNYRPKASLKFSGFYSDLGYQTPGGLTAIQFANNPKSARQATATLPSAETQKAGIYNQTFFGGIRHEFQFTSKWKHIISVSGTNTDFKNPFITNYEKRQEKSFALRTYLEFKNDIQAKLKYQWNTGWEFQETNSSIRNYRNNSGIPTSILAADQIKNQTQFLFTRIAFQQGERFKAELSTSVNFAKYSFNSLPESNNSSVLGSQRLKDNWMPRLALSYILGKQMVVRGIISKGFSTPTTAEIRASDAKINTNLQAESGWNYELGLRFWLPSESVYLDFSTYYYRLNNAIVRRVNAADQDYFVNAGGTNQKGIELQLISKIIKNHNGLIQNLGFNNALSLNDYKFRDYSIGTNNFSGNILTGVPKINLNSNLSFDFEKGFGLFVQYQYNGKTSLNDDATIFADSYQLMMMKLSWQKRIRRALLNFNFGVENRFNEKYSLGNDLNAFGGRYFNPAANRNYFASIGLSF